MRTLNGAMLLSLMLLLTGCASTCAVSEPVACEHPLVDLRKNGGLAEAVLLYSKAVDTCNALNGVADQGDTQ